VGKIDFVRSSWIVNPLGVFERLIIPNEEKLFHFDLLLIWHEAPFDEVLRLITVIELPGLEHNGCRELVVSNSVLVIISLNLKRIHHAFLRIKHRVFLFAMVNNNFQF